MLATYLEVLAKEGAAATTFRGRRGVHACLDASAARAGVAVGLGTGNLRAGAKITLDRVGLSERFSFGGSAATTSTARRSGASAPKGVLPRRAGRANNAASS